MATVEFLKKVWGFIRKNYLSIIVFGGIYFIFFYFFRPGLLFSLTTPTGGDMGSHYYNAFYSSKAFLQNPGVFNWDFSWYAGYPPFIFYMPLAFALIAILNIVLPLQIAFKLIAILGIFLLPPAAYYLIRAFKLEKTYAYLGAVLSLIFLFNNNMQSSAQIWGGTVMSVLAGEFAQSLSIALALFFLGSFWKALDSGKKGLLPVFLLAAIPITHPLSFLWAGVTALALFLCRFSKENLKYVLKLGLLVLALDAFWLAPTLIYKSKFFFNVASFWATKFKDILPQAIIFWPIFLIPAFFNERKKHQNFALFTLFGMGAAFLFSLLAIKIGIYPVRFYPYLQLSFLLSGIFVIAALEKKFLKVLPILAIAIAGLFILTHWRVPVDSWIKWNFDGLEPKTNARELIQAHKSLAGSLNDPRLMVEFSDANNDTGTPRNNEIVPLLAGRQTLEGLYMFSSITNPFIFKLQSEVSANKNCQTDVIGLPCGEVDYDLGVEHLKLFNVKHFIARSDKIKKILLERSDFKRLGIFGVYEAWEFLGNKDGYVSVPEFQPVFYPGSEEWKKISFNWFNKKEMLDLPIVFNSQCPYDIGCQKVVDLESGSEKAPIKNICNISEELSPNKIKFKTDCVGLPHIIKVSYFPAWGVKGADKIFLVSPSFMLVYPEKEEVELKFGNGGIAKLLSKLPFISLLALLALAFRKYKTA